MTVAIATALAMCGTVAAKQIDVARQIRVGVIGLDTSHAVEFTRLMNDPTATDSRAACRVICAYPQGSRDIESSASRIPKYTAEMEALQVDIVDSIESLVERVDAVLLETNDGRLHLTQILPVLRAKKPVFMDKPAAASLADVVAIYAAARHYETPLFSASALRFSQPALEARAGRLVGRVLGCDTYSPATLEPTHTDLYWYGIHGVEQLFTVMGTGCESVSRVHTAGTDMVIGTWRDGRIGTFRGTRTGKHLYGGVVFGEEGVESTGGYAGYEGLVTAITSFFQSGIPPVSADETIELYAFMSAADACKASTSGSVQLADVLADAQRTAESKLRELGISSQ
jgi:predicted dehydrogenase